MDCMVDTSFDGGDELEGIVFMPAGGNINVSRETPDVSKYRTALPWMRIDLSELDLMGGNGFSISIEDEESSAGCALVDRADEDF